MKCCICKKEIEGYAHNPDGAIDMNGNAISWRPEDMCCEDCNTTYVLPGRIALMTRRNIEYTAKVDLKKEEGE